MEAIPINAALVKIRNWCARQERNHAETRTKLYAYGLKTKEVENIIAALINDGFISEERFAKQFAGGKFRMKKWGRLKIEYYLKQKKISPYCIARGLGEIEEKAYRKTIEGLIHKKMKNTGSSNSRDSIQKTARYLIGKGYESELVWEILKSYSETA